MVSSQETIKAYGLGYAFWALLVGLLISNTIGTPAGLKPAIRTELYIKIGLVLLGGEILFNKMLALGGPGLLVAWVVTPTVIIFMYFFGTKTLKMASEQLVIIVAAATSVCGVSAAIATAGACRAKKDELTLAVGMTLIFTVIMMVLMPLGIKAVGMDALVGGGITAFCLAHSASEISQFVVSFAFHPLFQGFKHFTDSPLAVLIEGGGYLDGIGAGQQLLYQRKAVMDAG